jgi:hypothetical protein
VADAVQRNQSPIQEQGIFLESRAKTGPQSARQPSIIANSDVIIDSYSSLSALSCYCAEQALEAQNRQLEAIRRLNPPNRATIRPFALLTLQLSRVFRTHPRAPTGRLPSRPDRRNCFSSRSCAHRAKRAATIHKTSKAASASYDAPDGPSKAHHMASAWEQISLKEPTDRERSNEKQSDN